jgi:hypothetical protein
MNIKQSNRWLVRKIWCLTYIQYMHTRKDKKHSTAGQRGPCNRFSRQLDRLARFSHTCQHYRSSCCRGFTHMLTWLYRLHQNGADCATHSQSACSPAPVLS